MSRRRFDFDAFLAMIDHVLADVEGSSEETTSDPTTEASD